MSLTWLLTNFLAAFLLPPLNGLAPVLLGLFLLRRRPVFGRRVIAFGSVLLFAFSLRPVASSLMAPLESRYPPLPPAQAGSLSVDAIVVLGGGRYREAPEFGGNDDIKGPALERLRYGAWLARISGRPLLVTGGKPDDSAGLSEGQAMANALRRDFGVEPRWIEERAEDTRQNALYSAEILLPAGVRRIALVTNAFHMPRSVIAFRNAGFDVMPAPTGFMAGSGAVKAMDVLPRFEPMRESGIALREWIGLAWQQLRGR